MWQGGGMRRKYRSVPHTDDPLILNLPALNFITIDFENLWQLLDDAERTDEDVLADLFGAR